MESIAIILFGFIIIFLFALKILVNRIDKIYYFLKHDEGKLGEKFREYLR